MADEVTGLDCDGLIKHHYLICRYRLNGTFQRVKMHILVDAFKLAKLAFATDRDFRFNR
ncbi:hypothetical protein D3C75_1375230 [compost metagenome]